MRFLVIPVAVLLLAGASQGTRKGSPEDPLPAEHRPADAFRRACVVVARRQANCLHGKELRRRLRSRRRHKGHAAPDALRAPGISPRAVPAKRRLLPDRRAHLYRHPDDEAARPGDVDPEGGCEARRAAAGHRPQDLRGRRDLEAVDEDRVVEHTRSVSGHARARRVGHLHRGYRLRRRAAAAREQAGNHSRQIA